MAKSTRKRTAKAKRSKGQYSCNVCGLVVSVDNICGCVDACDIICCGEQMNAK